MDLSQLFAGLLGRSGSAAPEDEQAKMVEQLNALIKREAQLDAYARSPGPSPGLNAIINSSQYHIPVHMPPDQMPSVNVEDRRDPTQAYYGMTRPPHNYAPGGPMASQLGLQNLPGLFQLLGAMRQQQQGQ
jgi:hypothetical protein